MLSQNMNFFAGTPAPAPLRAPKLEQQDPVFTTFLAQVDDDRFGNLSDGDSSGSEPDIQPFSSLPSAELPIGRQLDSIPSPPSLPLHHVNHVVPQMSRTPTQTRTQTHTRARARLAGTVPIQMPARAATQVHRGYKRPLPSPTEAVDVGTLIQERNLKKRRLARKAELARVSRRRKKEKLSVLEAQLSESQRRSQHLQMENAELKRLLAKYETAAAAPTLAAAPVVAPQETITASIGRLVAEQKRVDISPKDAPNGLDGLLSALSRSFIARDELTKESLTKLATNVEPTLPIRFLQWALAQKDQFYSDDSGLWSCLFKGPHSKIKASDQQIQQLMSLRDEMRALNEANRRTAEACSIFGQHLRYQHARSQDAFSKIRNIFKNEQLGNFFLWADNNDLFIKHHTSIRA